MLLLGWRLGMPVMSEYLAGTTVELVWYHLGPEVRSNGRRSYESVYLPNNWIAV